MTLTGDSLQHDLDFGGHFAPSGGLDQFGVPRTETLENPSQKGQTWCSLFSKIPLQCPSPWGDRRSQDG